MSAVLIENVHKSFGDLEVLKGVSLSVEAGQVVAIIGRSGSGKSTLLRCVNGLEAIQSGRISVAGHAMSQDAKALRELRKDVGIVFQSYNLFPHITVGENIMLAPRIAKGLDPADVKKRATLVLEQVGLLEKFDAYPDNLSGGRHVAIAVHQPANAGIESLPRRKSALMSHRLGAVRRTKIVSECALPQH